MESPKIVGPMIFPSTCLQDKNNNQEIKSLQRIGKYDNDKSRYCTDKRSKERNHIRNTDDHTDQYGIWHLHDQKNDIADNSDNGRIQYLSADKSAKDLVALSGCLYMIMFARFGLNSA